jgi:hypothetical protein
MADQTKVNDENGNEPIERSDSLGENIGGFANDLLVLTELQSQLLIAELRELRQRCILPSMFLIVGLLLGASCVPVALIAFAIGLAQWPSLSLVVAFMIVLAMALTSSLVLLIVSWLLVRKRISFQRTQQELSRNYQWIKSAFKNNRTSARNHPLV